MRERERERERERDNAYKICIYARFIFNAVIPICIKFHFI